MNAWYNPGKTNLFYNLIRIKKIVCYSFEQNGHCLTSQERKEISMIALNSSLLTMERRRTQRNAGIKLIG